MSDITISLKECTRKTDCIHPDGPLLPATREYFYAKERGRYGLEGWCKLCHNAKTSPTSKAWNEAHRERTRQHQRDFYNRNKERLLREQAEHRKANPGSTTERYRRWLVNNHAKHAIKEQRRRALKRKSIGYFDLSDVELQFKSQRGRCWHCGKKLTKKYHVDHLVPLARGGSNDARNIVISCGPCNMSKGAKMTSEWNGRLF